MKFQLISDVHGLFQRVQWSSEADLVLAAGDISEDLPESIRFLTTAPAPVLLVAGNHEYYGGDFDERAKELRALCDQTHGRVTLLEKEMAIIGDTRILGATLWSDFGWFSPDLVDAAMVKMNDYKHILAEQRMANSEWMEAVLELGKNLAFLRRTQTKKKREFDVQTFQKTGQIIDRRVEIDLPSSDLIRELAQQGLFTAALSYLLHRETTAWLEHQLSQPWSGKTLVMTHHAPSHMAVSMGGYATHPQAQTLSPWFKRYLKSYKIGAYSSSLEHIALRHRIDAWVHGHFHEKMQYRMGHSVVFCNPSAGITSTPPAPFIFSGDDLDRRNGLSFIIRHSLIICKNLMLWARAQNELHPEQHSTLGVVAFQSIWNEVQVLLGSFSSLPPTEVPPYFYLHHITPWVFPEDHLLSAAEQNKVIRDFIQILQTMGEQLARWNLDHESGGKPSQQKKKTKNTE